MSTNVIPEAPPLEAPKEVITTKVDKDDLLDALKVSWCYGYNNDIGVINLCINDSNKMFLASSHIGIIHDFKKNEQKLLQGHRNSISCVTVSEDKRWLVTADAGADSTIIIWDLTTYSPVQTYFNTHLQGVVYVAFTPDSKFIASLSADFPQVLAVWEWTTDNDSPICTAELHSKFGLQTFIKFNPLNTFQIVTNSANQTLFFEWSFENGFQYFSPELNDQTFNKPIGRLTQSLFQMQSTQALTGTSLGCLVVWKTVEDADNLCNKKAFKLFKLQEKSINVLKSMNDNIVIGDADGQIKFIDQNLHVIMWFKHFNLGPINSISFSQTTKDFKKNNELTASEADATINQNKFICQDFLLSTNSATVAHITKSCAKINIIYHGSDTGVYGLACHPTLHRLCFGNVGGVLQLWDYQTHTLICTRSFSKNMQINCLAYDHQGFYIAIGFANGNLQIVDAITLDDCLQTPFSYAKDCITHIKFSHDSNYLATAEADFTVSVYLRNFNRDARELYTVLGRFRSHYKPIVDLLFGLSPDTNEICLYSLGKDRVLVEYDLTNSNFDDLVVKNLTRIEQYAVPLSMIWYPPITKESFLLTFNDQWKYKLYNSTTKMCRKTLLGPTFGSLFKKFILIPTEESPSEKRYLAYITEDKLGLQKLPLTGNPFESIAMFCHPDGVSNLVSSYDGKYLFTSGGENNNVLMWNINFESLEAQSLLGGADLIPFYGLMEGGRDGPLFKEMKELFYYSQLRHQGLESNYQRIIKLTIPLSEIPFVMRGLGFYPTEQEIDDMMNEIKFSRYVDTKEYVEAIDLNELIRLYINHRPAFGLDPYEIYNAFKVVSNSNQAVERNTFMSDLQNIGEHMTEYELADCLSNLLHLNYSVDDMSIEDASKMIETYLPENINIDTFMSHLMGVPKESFDEIFKSWQLTQRINSPHKEPRQVETKNTHYRAASTSTTTYNKNQIKNKKEFDNQSDRY